MCVQLLLGHIVHLLACTMCTSIRLTVSLLFLYKSQKNSAYSLLSIFYFAVGTNPLPRPLNTVKVLFIPDIKIGQDHFCRHSRSGRVIYVNLSPLPSSITLFVPFTLLTSILFTNPISVLVSTSSFRRQRS